MVYGKDDTSFYLTTTVHTVFAHIKAMVTGWEES